MRGSYYHESTSSFERSVDGGWRSPLMMIIVACIALFVCQIVLTRFFVIDLTRTLGLVPSAVVNKFSLWQFVTSMFLHEDVLHIVINLVILYLFGRELEVVLGRFAFCVLFFASGIYGGLGYVLWQYAAGAESTPCIGASGAVFGIMMAYACHWPNRPVMFFLVIPMRAWTAVMIFIGIELLYAIGNFQTGIANAAHLAGALTAFLMVKFGGPLDDWLDRREAAAARRKFLRNFERKRRVDEILGKISREGMPSLTKEERRFLEKTSRDMTEGER